MSANHARRWQRKPVQHPERQTKQVKIKVRKKSWITKGEKLLYALTGVGFICASIYIVSFSSSADKLNREVTNLEAKIEQQQLDNENLMLEVKEYSRPERIVDIAKKAGLELQNAQVKQANTLKR